MTKDREAVERRNAFKAVGAKPRRFKVPKLPPLPTDIADLLDCSADRADEIGLAAEGLVGGARLLRNAAAEIRRLSTPPAASEPTEAMVEAGLEALKNDIGIGNEYEDRDTVKKILAAALKAPGQEI